MKNKDPNLGIIWDLEARGSADQTPWGVSTKLAADCRSLPRARCSYSNSVSELSFLASYIFMACLIDVYFVLGKPPFDARLSHHIVLTQELLDLYSWYDFFPPNAKIVKFLKMSPTPSPVNSSRICNCVNILHLTSCNRKRQGRSLLYSLLWVYVRWFPPVYGL